MSYVQPAEFTRQLIDAGEKKVFLSTRDTLIRAFMAGAILGLAEAFAVTVAVQTGNALLGAMLFPVGFILLNLLGFDLLTGVFTLVPLALLDKRRGVTMKGLWRNWGLVFVGNFVGALVVVALFMFAITYGFQVGTGDVVQRLAEIGEARTLGYAEFGAAGMATVFVRAMLCSWMVSTGVVAAFMSTSVAGKALAMWMPIMLFFYLGFEHAVVNMFLFPAALVAGGDFTVGDYFMWNQIPVLLGNLVGGLLFVGLTVYFTHARTAPDRRQEAREPQ